MWLQTLKLTQFKNYAARTFEFSPRLNCLTGLNGTGKTNVLDAIHLLCLTKNHNGLNDKQLVLHGETFFRVEGLFREEQKKDKVVAKFIISQRKEIEKNGAVFNRLSEYVGQFPVVMVAPDDVSLVQEGSEERRRFMDNTLSQISSEYLHNLLIYNQLLKQRNALLKNFAEQRYFDSSLLESLDQQMPAPAQLIYAHRRQFIADFTPLFQEMYAAISAGHEEISLAYEADQEERNLSDSLRDTLEKDRLLQRTTTGPHRDDLILRMDGQVVKKFASQGQLKSCLLALRLAQYEVLRRAKNIEPLLLLDDIFDKLDEQRVRQLIGLLLDRHFGQLFITDTHRERIENIIASFTGDYKIFEISTHHTNAQQ